MFHSSFFRSSSEGGFTLVELVIGIGIGTMLIWAVGAAFVVGLRTTEEAGNQVGEAAWAQIVGNWFLTDVQSAEDIGGETCGISPSAVVGSFTWSADDGSQRHAAWWLSAGSEGSGYDVHRTECDTGPISTMVIAEGIQDIRIACEAYPDEIPPTDALQCTAAWTTAPDVPVVEWPYRLTAVRRPG